MPTLIFDGECGFCRRCVEWLRPQTQGVDYTSYQERGSKFQDIPTEDLEKEVHYIDDNGERYKGAAAIYKACAKIPGLGFGDFLYRKFPFFDRISEKVYEWVASNRPLVSSITKWGMGDSFVPSSYYLVRWFFLRGLGFLYFTAFLSLFFQLPGLIGENGILPAGDFLEAVKRHYAETRFWELPTLAWISSSTNFLLALCVVGGIGSLLLMIGVVPFWGVLLSWLCFLSLSGVGGVFLQYQWENLLLECGFLALFFTPRTIKPNLSTETAPSRIVVFLYRWLLFRLMFSSGISKIASGDETWTDLSALSYHFESQPLPTWIAWYVHQLPELILQLSTIFMFVIEIGVAWFILFPRQQRKWAFWPLIGLQVLILLTGNYTYFNYLTILLCLFLLDDEWIRTKIKWIRNWKVPQKLFHSRHKVAQWALQGMLILFLLLGSFRILGAMNFPRPDIFPFRTLFNWSNRLHIIAGYGLFAVMTPHRDELIIQGSNDKLEWKDYSFRWKPEDLGKAPPFVAPHQPRLDWQAWFASLSYYDKQPWVQNLVYRLLTGQAEVLKLMGKNPFPEAPPKYIRILRYRYHFTTWEERNASGGWWKRKILEAYGPTVSLEP